jgi:hypothetical protein
MPGTFLGGKALSVRKADNLTAICGSLDVSQLYGFPQIVTWIAFPLPVLCFIWDSWRFLQLLNILVCILTAASLWLHSSICRIEIKIRQQRPSWGFLRHIQAGYGVVKLRRYSAAWYKSDAVVHRAVSFYWIFSIDCANEGISWSVSDIDIT